MKIAHAFLFPRGPVTLMKVGGTLDNWRSRVVSFMLHTRIRYNPLSVTGYITLSIKVTDLLSPSREPHRILLHP